MGVDMKVKAIYDSEIGNITRSEKNWKDVLKVAGPVSYTHLNQYCIWNGTYQVWFCGDSV